MSVKGIMVTAGISAAVGAVGVLMLSKANPTRKLAAKAADKMEDLAWQISDSLSSEFRM